MLRINKWAIGFSKQTEDVALRFEFLDRAPLELSIPKDHAEQIARAILDQAAAAVPVQN